MNRIIITSFILLATTLKSIHAEVRELYTLEVKFIAQRLDEGLRVSYTISNPLEDDLCLLHGDLDDSDDYYHANFLAFYRDGSRFFLASPPYVNCDSRMEQCNQPRQLVLLPAGGSLQSSLAISADDIDDELTKLGQIQVVLFATTNCQAARYYSTWPNINIETYPQGSALDNWFRFSSKITSISSHK